MFLSKLLQAIVNFFRIVKKNDLPQFAIMAYDPTSNRIDPLNKEIIREVNNIVSYAPGSLQHSEFIQEHVTIIDYCINGWDEKSPIEERAQHLSDNMEKFCVSACVLMLNNIDAFNGFKTTEELCTKIEEAMVLLSLSYLDQSKSNIEYFCYFKMFDLVFKMHSSYLIDYYLHRFFPQD